MKKFKRWFLLRFPTFLKKKNGKFKFNGECLILLHSSFCGTYFLKITPFDCSFIYTSHTKPLFFAGLNDSSWIFSGSSSASSINKIWLEQVGSSGNFLSVYRAKRCLLGKSSGFSMYERCRIDFQRIQSLILNFVNSDCSRLNWKEVRGRLEEWAHLHFQKVRLELFLLIRSRSCTVAGLQLKDIICCT